LTGGETTLAKSGHGESCSDAKDGGVLQKVASSIGVFDGHDSLSIEDLLITHATLLSVGGILVRSLALFVGYVLTDSLAER
jgi:hypothetical protein